MNGRSNIAILALVSLLAAAFAGCVEAPSFLTSSDAEASARENKDLADNAAAAWNPEAVLVGVTAFEASAAHAQEAQGMVPVDPTVGNGRALLWFYAYQTPGGNESRLFRVDADGRIQVENTSMVPMKEIGALDPVDGWAIDSDAAMSAARADERFDQAVKAENASVVSAVGNHEGVTKWALVALTEETVVGALVDATTGELLMVESSDVADIPMPAMPSAPGFEMSSPVHLEGSGSLDGSTRSEEHAFSYLGTGDAACLELTVSKRLPTDAIHWYVVDAEGEEVDGGHLGGMRSMSSADTFFFELDQPGDYTLVLDYMPTAMLALGGVDYEFVLEVGPLAAEHAKDME